MQSHANDTNELYSLNRVQINLLNVQNLGELLAILPFYFTQYSSELIQAQDGINSVNSSTIYLDNLPLFQDDGSQINLELIAINNLDKIVIATSTVQNTNLRISPLIIKLYTSRYDLSASESRVSLGSNAKNDVQLNGLTKFSNYKHSAMLDINRNFKNGYRLNNELREYDWLPSRNFGITGKYSLKLYKNALFEVSNQFKHFFQMNKQPLIESTNRAIDRHRIMTANRFTSKLITPISKYHKVTLGLRHHLSSSSLFSVAKDFSVSENKPLPVNFFEDSLKTRNAAINMFLSRYADSSRFNYLIGFEYANTKDLNHPIILAIPTSYAHFNITLQGSYTIPKYFNSKFGVQLLTNNLLGNYMLPEIMIKYIGAENLTFAYHRKTGLEYPIISQLFYPKHEVNSAIEHNPFLLPIFQTIHQVIVHFERDKNISVTSGMVFTNHKNVFQPRLVDNTPKWSNESTYNSVRTFILGKIKNNWFSLTPSAAIHGVNYAVDSNAQFLFYPEIGILSTVCNTKKDWNFSLNIKHLGARKELYILDGLYYQRNYNKYTFATIAASKSSFKNKIHITAGIDNFTNLTSLGIQNFSYNGTTLDPLESGNTLINRGRTFFIKLTIGAL